MRETVQEPCYEQDSLFAKHSRNALLYHLSVDCSQ